MNICLKSGVVHDFVFKTTFSIAVSCFKNERLYFDPPFGKPWIRPCWNVLEKYRIVQKLMRLNFDKWGTHITLMSKYLIVGFVGEALLRNKILVG